MLGTPGGWERLAAGNAEVVVAGTVSSSSDDPADVPGGSSSLRAAWSVYLVCFRLFPFALNRRAGDGAIAGWSTRPFGGMVLKPPRGPREDSPVLPSLNDAGHSRCACSNRKPSRSLWRLPDHGAVGQGQAGGALATRE